MKHGCNDTQKTDGMVMSNLIILKMHLMPRFVLIPGHNYEIRFLGLLYYSL